jgi:hypothetical protein
VASAPSAPGISPNVPSAPSFQSPGAFQPINTGQSGATLYGGISNDPFSEQSYPSAYTLANNAEGADAALGPSLSIVDNSGPGGLFNTNPNNQINGQSAYEQAFYNNNIAPAIAQTQQNVYNSGMGNSSAGGAEIGTAMAQGGAQEGLAGQQYYTNALNNFLNTRQSFFGGEGNLATNSAGGQQTAAQNTAQNAIGQNQINAGLNTTLANYGAANSQNQNIFNQGNAQNANQFNQANFATNAGISKNQQDSLNQQYGTSAGIYGNQLQAKGNV